MKIETGRTHQIRVHLKALKSPLYYDFLYNEKIDDKRLSLECIYLSFYDKFLNKKIAILLEKEIEFIWFTLYTVSHCFIYKRGLYTPFSHIDFKL